MSAWLVPICPGSPIFPRSPPSRCSVKRRQLKYKALAFGSELQLVPPAFTSQDCPACGARDKDSRPGCGREFACTSCGHADHADRNATVNIENRARRAGGPNSTRRHLYKCPKWVFQLAALPRNQLGKIVRSALR